MPFYLPTTLPPEPEQEIALPDIGEWNGILYDAQIVKQGKSRLLLQYQGKPRIENLLRALMIQLQEFKRASWDVFTLTGIDHAIGAQLDTLGELVGEPRRDRDDDTYRRWIRARITVNRSSGKITDFYTVLRLLYPEFPSAILDAPPATIRIEIYGDTEGEHGEIFRLLRLTKVAGHRVEYRYRVSPDSLVLGSTVDGSYGGRLGSSVSGSGSRLGGVRS